MRPEATGVLGWYSAILVDHILRGAVVAPSKHNGQYPPTGREALRSLMEACRAAETLAEAAYGHAH